MAKNMYQKREERKNKPVEEKDNSTKINWDIGTNVKPPSNPYNISFY